MVTLVGTPTATSNDSDGADTGTFKLRFKVEAVGDTAFVGSLASKAVTYVVYDSNGVATTSGAFSASIQNHSDTTKTTVGNYEIEEDTDEEMTLTVTVPNGPGDADDQYYVAITGVKWDNDDIATPAETYTSNLDAFQTPTVFLDNN